VSDEDQVEKNSPENRSWAKVKEAAEYAGVSPRTLRDWLKNGLRHSRVSAGMILISYAAIDEYLAGFEVRTNQLNDVVDQILKEIQS
jgi:excisionase family DNA binding protein